MDNPIFKAPVEGHFIDASGECHAVALHYKAECNGSESSYVATETDVLSIDATTTLIDPADYQGGGELHVGPCCCEQQIPVYTCGWTHNPEGWDTSWWYGDDAAAVVRITPPDQDMDSQQADVSQSFVINGTDIGHTNDPSDRICGQYINSGSYRDVYAPNYDPLVHHTSPSQGMQKGWVRIPKSESEAQIVLRIASSSATSLYAGFDESTIAPIAENISAPFAITGDGRYGAKFFQQDAIFELGDYWYIYVVAITADVTASSVHRVDYALADGVVRFIPKSEISCQFPELGQSARLEDQPYILDTAAGESFGPCKELPTGSMVVAGVEYAACHAADDGRTIFRDVSGSSWVESDLVTPVPAGVTCAAGSSDLFIPKERCYLDSAGEVITLEVDSAGDGEVVKASESIEYSLGDAVTATEIATLTQVDCPCCGQEATQPVDQTALPYVVDYTCDEPYQTHLSRSFDRETWITQQFTAEGEVNVDHSRVEYHPDGRPFVNGESTAATATTININDSSAAYGGLEKRYGYLQLPSVYRGNVARPIKSLKFIDNATTATEQVGSLWLSVDPVSGLYSMERDTLVKVMEDRGSYEVNPQQLGRYVYVEAYLSDAGVGSSFHPMFEIVYDNNGTLTTVTEAVTNYMTRVSLPPTEATQFCQRRTNYNAETGVWSETDSTVLSQQEVDLFRKKQPVSMTTLPITATLFYDSATGVAQIQNIFGGDGQYEVSWDEGATWSTSTTKIFPENSFQTLPIVRDSSGLTSAKVGWASRVYQNETCWELEIASGANLTTTHPVPSGWTVEHRGAFPVGSTFNNQAVAWGGTARTAQWNSGLIAYDNDTGVHDFGWVEFVRPASDMVAGKPYGLRTNIYNNRQGVVGDVLGIPFVTFTDAVTNQVLGQSDLDLGADEADLRQGDLVTGWRNNKPTLTGFIATGNDIIVRITQPDIGTADANNGYYGFGGAQLFQHPEFGAPIANTDYIRRENAGTIRWNAMSGDLLTEPHKACCTGLLVPQFRFTHSGNFTADDILTLQYRVNGGAWQLMHAEPAGFDAAGETYMSPFIFHEGIPVTEGDDIEYSVDMDFGVTPAGKWLRLTSVATKAVCKVD